MALRTQVYRVVVLLAVAWALANCAYVYLVRGGQAAYRIESAVILLVVVLAPLAARRRGAMPPPTTRPAAAALSARATWLLLAGMAMVWLATYLPLVAFPFLSDDYVFLELYRSLDEVDRSPQFVRPVFASVFWLLAVGPRPSGNLLRDWQQWQRVPLVLRGPVPIECQGVNILANGYDEFVRHVRRRAAGS